jgi:ribosome-associated toxin RatA of RatAB toxin-antitoxin module
MLNIESKIVTVNTSVEQLFGLINQIENFQKFLPADRVENFEWKDQFCSFTIKGISKIGFKIDETETNKKIVFRSEGKNPFDFSITAVLDAQSENQSTAQIKFSGNANAFIAMMAEKPLNNFFNMIADNVSNLYK